MTGLTGASSFKNFDDEFALTNALRKTGTDHLLEAARQSGVRHFIAQSFGGWIYERTGSDLKSEEHPLDPRPPAHQLKSLDAIRYAEKAVVTAEGMHGIALRYGFFYGRVSASPWTATL
jgi:nucleoside-diphosphate-sugar epimerase